MNEDNKVQIRNLVLVCLQIDITDLKECLVKQIDAKSTYEAIGIIDGHKYINNMAKANKETKKLKAIIKLVEALRNE